MTDKNTQIREFIEKYDIGRDNFIAIISMFQADKTLETLFFWNKGTHLTIEAEAWMKDVKNKRRTYEDAVMSGFESQDEVLPSLKLIKQNKRLQDKNTELNKYFTGNLRELNRAEEILEEIRDTLKDIDFEIPVQNADSVEHDKVGIMQLSDIHFNEIINEPDNKYDFTIASQRLKFFTDKAIKHFKANGVTTVYLFNTGDNINSNRRDSEKVNACTGRVHASMIAVKLLASVIVELAQHFQVKVAFCGSNESRIEKVYEMDELSAGENFDIIIYNILKMLFSNSPIHFIDCDYAEGIVLLQELDMYVLLTHGAPITEAGIQKKIQEIKGKYASRGILISFIFFGDKHSCHISDTFARSASLSGGNGFSGMLLGFDSRASQNVFIAYSNGVIDGTKIDVQSANCEGYNILPELHHFGVKTVIERMW